MNDLYQTQENNARIKCIGIGGGGGNAVRHMIHHQLQGVEFYVMNTDRQVLDLLPLDEEHKIPLGPQLTHGLGAGGNPNVGREAAHESEKAILDVVQDADLIFLSAGMGGGTGCGAIAPIAKMAKSEDVLTVACVTEPFRFEGAKRKRVAKEGLAELKNQVDALILVSNDNLLSMIGRKPLKMAFGLCDDVLRQCVQTITDLIMVPALINLDFADVKSILKNSGLSFFGIGMAEGGELEHPAQEAAQRAVTSPLLKHQLKGAKKALVNITGGPSMSLFDSQEAIETIKAATSEDLELIYGVAINENLNDAIIVTLIATGFEETETETLQQKTKPFFQDVIEPSFRNMAGDVEVASFAMDLA